MKWLILLALISCGKHDEPKKLDLRDSDGDQILNYQESELGRFVADIEPLGKVKGVLKINLGAILEIPISNESDLVKNSLDLMVANDQKLPAEDYFQEWSKLRLSKIPADVSVKQNIYQIYLQFENGSAIADEVVLINGNAHLALGKWTPLMKMQISGENLKALLDGKASIALKKHFRKSALFHETKDETIKNKTYRVHFYDGQKTRILYVSNELPFPQLLKLLDVVQVSAITPDEIFFNAHQVENDMWYTRALQNGDKVVAFTNVATLREKLLKNYVYQKKVFQRVNGSATKPFQFNNPEGAQVYLKLSHLHFTERTFVETRKIKRHGQGQGGGFHGNGGTWYDCIHFLRKIKDEKNIYTHLPSFLENIGQSELLLSADILEQLNSDVPYWEIKLSHVPANYEWQFINRPSSTYTVTGEYDNSCGSNANRGRGAAHKTNLEGKFSVLLESYVEKIN